MAYQIALPPSLSNLHNVFHVSQLRKYSHDPSHVIELDDVQVKENLTYETLPLRVEDRQTALGNQFMGLRLRFEGGG